MQDCKASDLQALQPFIDPATAKKVRFVGKDNEAAQMPGLFPMDKMEACLGGTGGNTYNTEAYGGFCKEMEASRRSLGTAAAAPSANTAHDHATAAQPAAGGAPAPLAQP